MTTTHLYHLKGLKGPANGAKWDCAHEVVIRATTHHRAREIADKAHLSEGKGYWLSAEYASCHAISAEGIEGVVLQASTGG